MTDNTTDTVPPTEATEPAGTTSSDQPKGWRAFLPIHPAAELFPLMSEAELKELAADIDKHDLAEPVCLYHDPELGPCVLDGRNRFDALELLNWEAGTQAHEPPSKRQLLPAGLYQWAGEEKGFDPYAYVLSKNAHRRHLTSEQKRELIAKVLKAKPEASNLQIAKQTTADDKTVAKVRSELETRSEIPNVPTRTDTKGREQPARRARKEPSAAEREERERERIKRRAERRAKELAEHFPWAVERICDSTASSPYREDQYCENGDDYGDLIIPPMAADTAAKLIPDVEKAIENLKRLKAKLAEIACGGDVARQVH